MIFEQLPNLPFGLHMLQGTYYGSRDNKIKKQTNCSSVFLTFHCGSAKELLENGTFKFSMRFKAPEINTTHLTGLLECLYSNGHMSIV